MYVLQTVPDEKVTLRSGSVYTPIATLKDEYGGVSHIIVDDHCYILVNGSYDGGFATVKHWYREAVEAMQGLPLPTQTLPFRPPTAVIGVSALAEQAEAYNEQYKHLEAKINGEVARG